MQSKDPQPDFCPTANWERLRLRAALLRKVRAFFEARGYLEVETPLLSADTVVDVHLEPFATQFTGHGAAAPRTLWLQTSPEFCLKRLLAAGGTALYQVCKAFRQGERGPRHNPEFTLVEWYKVGDDFAAGMQLLSDLAEALLDRGPAERLSYRDALRQHAAVDPFTAEVAELRAAAQRLGLAVAHDFSAQRNAWLELLVAEAVEPHLGRGRPTILWGYPPTQAALACVAEGPPPYAERFELYVEGVELANGYHELLDAEQLAARQRENNAQRVALGRAALPEDNRLLAAMRHGLPRCAGCALGFDRLVMLAAGATSIDEVLAFPLERA